MYPQINLSLSIVLQVNMQNYVQKRKPHHNRTYTYDISRGQQSQLTPLNNPQDLESFLSFILDLIRSNEASAQKEIDKLKNQVLRKKLLELNQMFQYFLNRIDKLQYSINYLQTIFKHALKGVLKQPSLNDYKHQVGLIEVKFWQDIIRLTNNSKLLSMAIEGVKLKIQDCNQFGTGNVIDYIKKIAQRFPLIKKKPLINEQQLKEQFTKLSNGTFNKLNTKMVNYCKQKATLDLLETINNQILQGRTKVKYQCINDNLIHQSRNKIKNHFNSIQKIDKEGHGKHCQKCNSIQPLKSLQQLINVFNKLYEESNRLNNRNQRLVNQMESKQQNLRGIQSGEIISQQNKRLSAQINKVKSSNKHQLQKIGQLQEKNNFLKDNLDLLKRQNQLVKFSISSLNKKIKTLQAKIQYQKTIEDNDQSIAAKQLEQIQQLNMKIDEYKQNLERLSKQHEESVGQRNRQRQVIEKYKQQLALKEKCLSQEKENNTQSMKKITKQREILLNQKGICELTLNQAIKQIKLINLKNESLLNDKYLKNIKENDVMKSLQGQKDRLNKGLIEERSILQNYKIQLLQNKLSLIKMEVIKNRQRIKKQAQTIQVNQIMRQDMKNFLLSKLVKIKKENQEQLQEISSLEDYVDCMEQNQNQLLSLDNGGLSQGLIFLNNQNSQTYYQVNVQFRLASIWTQKQQVSSSLYYLKQVQNKNNLEMISKLNHQKSILEDFVQNLIAIQLSQRQHHFYFQKKLLKTIIFNSQQMEQIKSKINEIFGNFNGSLLECSPALLMSYVQNIQFDTNVVTNYIRSIEQQITEFNEQSLEQCREIQIDD